MTKSISTIFLISVLAAVSHTSNVGANYVVDSRGYFRDNASNGLFIPVGLNYWPSSTGAWLWFRSFPASEIQTDFATFQHTGFNAVRIFITWSAFEISPGVYNATNFQNLCRMLDYAETAGLKVNLSVFVGGMSGLLYWPDWVTGNIYENTTTRAQTAAFALKVSQTVAPYEHTLFALELGNEMNNLETQHVSVNNTISWTHLIYTTFKQGSPHTPVVPGVGDGALVRDTTWPLGGVTGRIAGDTLDFHPYAVLFEPTKSDGLMDPLTHAVTAYNTAAVRSHGSAFMQEWGTLVTGGVKQQDSYLRGVLPSALKQGANGFLWWCARDFPTVVDVLPYATHGKESLLGFYVANTSVIKPGLEHLAEFAKTVTAMTTPPPLPEDDANAIGLYFPAHHDMTGDPKNPGNNPSSTVVSGAIAYHLLTLLNKSVRVVWGYKPLPHAIVELKTLIIPSVVLVASEITALATWVRDGGQVLWHGIPTRVCNDLSNDAETLRTFEALIGGRCGEHISDHNISLDAFVRNDWLLTTTWRSPDESTLTTPTFVKTTAIRSWSTTTNKTVALLNKYGKGIALVVSAPVEAAINPSDEREKRDSWREWYAATLTCLKTGDCTTRSTSAALHSNHLLKAQPQQSRPQAKKGILSETASMRRQSQQQQQQQHHHQQQQSQQQSPPLPLPQQQQQQQQQQKQQQQHRDTILTPAAEPVGVYFANNTDTYLSVKSETTLANMGLVSVKVQSPLSRSNIATITRTKAIIIPSQTIVWLPDQEILREYVHGGGCLIWHGVCTSAFGATAFDMMGATAVDFRTPKPSVFEWKASPNRSQLPQPSHQPHHPHQQQPPPQQPHHHQQSTRTWTMGSFLKDVHVEVDTVSAQRSAWGTATKLSLDERGIATVLRNTFGKGTTITVTPAVEASLHGANLVEWYQVVLDECMH